MTKPTSPDILITMEQPYESDLLHSYAQQQWHKRLRFSFVALSFVIIGAVATIFYYWFYIPSIKTIAQESAHWPKQEKQFASAQNNPSSETNNNTTTSPEKVPTIEVSNEIANQLQQEINIINQNYVLPTDLEYYIVTIKDSSSLLWVNNDIVLEMVKNPTRNTFLDWWQWIHPLTLSLPDWFNVSNHITTVNELNQAILNFQNQEFDEIKILTLTATDVVTLIKNPDHLHISSNGEISLRDKKLINTFHSQWATVYAVEVNYENPMDVSIEWKVDILWQRTIGRVPPNKKWSFVVYVKEFDQEE